MYLLLSAPQCSHIAVIDPESSRLPRWHTGNIYAYSNVPTIKIPLVFERKHGLSKLEDPLESVYLTHGRSKQLDIIMGLDYEIRLFGDPLVFKNSTEPTILADLHVAIELSADSDALSDEDHVRFQNKQYSEHFLSPAVRSAIPDACVAVGDPASHVIPHFVGGWAYGDVIGIEITSCSHGEWWISQAHAISTGTDNGELGLAFQAFDPIVLAPSQTRTITLRIDQSAPLPTSIESLTVQLGLTRPNSHSVPSRALQVVVPIVNHASLAQPKTKERNVLLTYASVSNSPASAVVLLPEPADLEITPETRILLALHGAGVMHTNPAMINFLPRPKHTWVLIVQGLTPWGLDWREASRADVCSALRALVLKLLGSWSEAEYCTPHDAEESVILRTGNVKPIPVIALGHSNGGQGSLYLGSQFPDSIPALIPAAGYTSARLYISTQHSRGSLFADAALQGIMRASLQGQDGDLIAGNLVNSRVHLVHGGDDENVPVWHSRERMALIKAWDNESDVSLTEVSGKPHVWDTAFKDEPVASRVAELVAFPNSVLRSIQKPFTFTVIWPSEAGSMRGWRVRELSVPGRLARISVDGAGARTTNVHGISVDLSKANVRSDWIDIDNERIRIPPHSVVWLRRNSNNQWEVVEPFSAYHSGPLSRILSSPVAISIVIPDTHSAHYTSIALRIAHNLYTYLKLDCAIINDDEALHRGQLPGNTIVIGGSKNKYGIQTRSSPLKVLSDGSIWLSGVAYNQPGTAALSLHKDHLYMDAIDEAGYERALIAFPLRTGVPGPEWMIFGEDCDSKGYAGVYAAGFWDRQGGLSQSMSYFT